MLTISDGVENSKIDKLINEIIKKLGPILIIIKNDEIHSMNSRLNKKLFTI